MAGPFDITTRYLVQTFPTAWLELLGLYTLLGLRFPPELAQQLMPEITTLRESSTYQAILEEGRAEGRVEGLRSLLLELGTQRFGQPSAAVETELTALHDAAAIARIGQRLLGATSWDDLLSPEA
jgi:predicted transposase YdaD